MQSLGAVTYADLNLAGQSIFEKLEVWDGASWINLCSLGGVNYLINGTLAMTLGGPTITPEPIAGTWSAEIANDDGIFHPRHPSSAYAELLRLGRKVRISVGGDYGGAVYWQRMIGYMDVPKFSSSKRRVTISGMDYTKLLTDTLLRSPGNYWGSTATFSTVATSSGLGSEIYAEADALEIGAGEANNITNWTTDAACTAAAATDAGGGSTYVMRITKDTNVAGYTTNANVGAVTAGVEYECSFKYELTPAEGGGSLQAMMYLGAVLEGYSAAGESETWVAASFRFTASVSTNMTLKFKLLGDAGTVADVDQVSIKPVTTPGINTIYILPDASTGAYAATLNGLPIYKNDPPEKSGWGNVDGSNAFYFVDGTIVTAGTNNLVVYYYKEQAPENVVADLLAAGPDDAGGGAGLYANRAAALAAMTYVATGITIPKVWFETGSPALAAVQKVCERCNYRFWFDELGVPLFQPAPTHEDPVYWLTGRTFNDSGEFQSIEEVRNDIALEGIERAVYGPSGEVDNSRFKKVVSDATSIAAYQRRTYSSTNDLFQDQDSLDAAAAAMLAAFKDPKWYSELIVPRNPAPVQRGDTVEWDIELAPLDGSGGAGLRNTVRGIVRDVSYGGGDFTYKCEMRSTAMNISNHATGPVTVTAEHCRGWALTNSGASGDVQFNLPAATVGMEITFYVLAAQTLTVNPSGTERIAVLTNTNGDYLRSDAVIGSYLKLTCFAAGYWHKTDLSGTWTEE